MPVIKLRGLPWSCTPEDIEHFLGESIQIVKATSADNPEAGATLSICLTTNGEGRPSGEAFVELIDESDVEAALRKNNGMMGQRYIEVFRSSLEQMKRFTAESNESATHWRDPVVRIRGLPYGCTKKDVHEFFNGLSIAYDGILLVVDFSGRFNGEAFVQFSNMSDAHKALEKHKQKMGNRYLEIFRSSLKEKRHYSGDDSGDNNNYGGDFFAGGMGGGNDDGYENGGYSNGGGGGGRNGKIMNKRGMKGSNSGGRFNGSSNNGGMGGMGGGGMDNNRSRPYPNVRGGNSGGSIGGNRQNGDRGGGFGLGGLGGMGGPAFGNGNAGGIGGLPSLMANSFTPNVPAFGAGLGGGPPMLMGGAAGNNSFFNNNGMGGADFGVPFWNKNANNNDSFEPGFGLKMRGLPFSCREDDIYEFFAPLKPVRVEFLRGRDTRPSGECEVEFESQEELDEAMTYDKKFIGNRYIELFLLNNPSPSPNPVSTGNMSKSHSAANGGMAPPHKNGGRDNKSRDNNNQHHHGNFNNKNGSGGSGGRQNGGSALKNGSNGNSNSSVAGIPSLFAQPTLPALGSGLGNGGIGSGGGGGGGGMTTAYPHQQMAAAAYSATNNMGDMLMADMAKKMFQNAFAPYQNQMFHNSHQQIEPPQQFHQHFGSGGGGGGGGGNKSHNRRF